MKWTSDMISKLRELFPVRDNESVAAELGVTAKAAKSKAKVLGIKKNTSRKVWTDIELDYLKQFYPNTATHIICEKLNRSFSSVFGMVGLLGISKSESFRNSPLSGRLRPGTNIGGNSRFNKGNVSWNKGKKMPKGWGTPEMKRTQFKKGNVPSNVAKEGDGAIRIRKWTDGFKYQYIRIKPGKWIQLHQHVWVQNNGPIPKGHIVVFRDKNTMNCDINNLEMITLKENMIRNTIHRYPEELKKAMRTLGKLNRKIKSHEKQD